MELQAAAIRIQWEKQCCTKPGTWQMLLAWTVTAFDPLLLDPVQTLTYLLSHLLSWQAAKCWAWLKGWSRTTERWFRSDWQIDKVFDDWQGLDKRGTGRVSLKPGRLSSFPVIYQSRSWTFTVVTVPTTCPCRSKHILLRDVWSIPQVASSHPWQHRQSCHCIASNNSVHYKWSI